MKELFLQAYKILNDYRPHQARESLISIMEERVETLKEEAKRGREGVERVKEVLAGVSRIEVPLELEGKKLASEKLKEVHDLTIWELIEKETT